MRKITECTNFQLEAICHQVMTLEKLTERVQQWLPTTLQQHCTVASFNRGCLLLTTKDAVWASQLRYCLPELRENLRTHGFPQLTSVKIAMHIGGTTLQEPVKTEIHISKKAVDIIQQGASMQEYAPLKEALMNLTK